MKILYVINKMTNLAGIERILTCKMNYLSEESEYAVHLLTYEQPNQTLSFKLNEKISYCPINAPIPLREGLTLWRWMKAYFSAEFSSYSMPFISSCCHPRSASRLS